MKFSKLEIYIPQIVTARDYHEFRDHQQFLKELGLTNVSITEVGFGESEYLGVVHCTKDSKKKSFKDMKREFQKLSDNEEPFDADEILKKYYEKDCK